MKIAVVGTGYVGLVTGTCFAETGNHVICVDIDKNKVEKLQKGVITIYEPGLEVLFERNIRQKRLSFTTNLKEGIKDADVIFLDDTFYLYCIGPTYTDIAVHTSANGVDWERKHVYKMGTHRHLAAYYDKKNQNFALFPDF